MNEKSSILLVGTGVRKKCILAFGYSPIKIQYYEYPQRFITRINEAYDFLIQ